MRAFDMARTMRRDATRLTFYAYVTTAVILTSRLSSEASVDGNCRITPFAKVSIATLYIYHVSSSCWLEAQRSQALVRRNYRVMSIAEVAKATFTYIFKCHFGRDL